MDNMLGVVFSLRKLGCGDHVPNRVCSNRNARKAFNALETIAEKGEGYVAPNEDLEAYVKKMTPAKEISSVTLRTDSGRSTEDVLMLHSLCTLAMNAIRMAE
ncbi:unnamed protein product [Agarophyton chilense]